MSPPPSDSDAFHVRVEIPATGDATFTVTPQSLSGTDLSFFTAYISGELCRYKSIVTRSRYIPGQLFRVAAQAQGSPSAREFTARVDNPSPGIQPLELLLDTRDREIHALNGTLDFGNDGNVVVTIDLQPLEVGTANVGVSSGVGGEADQVSELSSLTFRSSSWQGKGSVELGYSEKDAQGSNRGMYGSTGFGVFTAGKTTEGVLHTTHSNT